MKLIYIYHSGFILQGTDFVAVIDYYKAGNPENEKFISELLMHYPGRLYVFVSHAHPDHFNPVILQWRRQRPDLRYIFSEDIQLPADSLPEHRVFMKKLETWQDEILRVKAFGSTDIGISFLIEGEEKRIFHAGDLNNWHWAEESTAEESRESEDHFLRELDCLAGEVEQVLLGDSGIGQQLPCIFGKSTGRRMLSGNMRKREVAGLLPGPIPDNMWNSEPVSY